MYKNIEHNICYNLFVCHMSFLEDIFFFIESTYSQSYLRAKFEFSDSVL